MACVVWLIESPDRCVKYCTPDLPLSPFAQQLAPSGIELPLETSDMRVSAILLMLFVPVSYCVYGSNVPWVYCRLDCSSCPLVVLAPSWHFLSSISLQPTQCVFFHDIVAKFHHSSQSVYCSHLQFQTSFNSMHFFNSTIV
jgi:hypothetical protein